MNKKIFISHSSSDNDIAEKVYQYFEKKGIGCWMDKHDIPPGARYVKAIMEGIKQCDAMVILISNNSINSDDVLNEIENAHNRGKTLFPFLIDDVKIASTELEYYISRIQWTTINGNNLANALDNLYTSINDKMGTINAAKNNPALRIQSPSMPEVVSSTGAEIHVKSDYDCQVYDYGRLLPTTIKANEDNIITLKAGDHDLKFVSCDLPDLSVEIEYNVRSNDSVAKITVSWTKWEWKFNGLKWRKEAMERKKEQQMQEEELNHFKQSLPSECVLKLKNKYSFRMKLSPTKKYYYIDSSFIFSTSESKDNKEEMVEVLDRLPLNFIDSEDCKQIENKYGIHFRKGSLAGIIQGSSSPCLILHLDSNKEFFQSLINQNTK